MRLVAKHLGGRHPQAARTTFTKDQRSRRPTTSSGLPEGPINGRHHGPLI